MLANIIWDNLKQYLGIVSQRDIQTDAGGVIEMHAWLPVDRIEEK
jgi:hypothetical protein